MSINMIHHTRSLTDTVFFVFYFKSAAWYVGSTPSAWTSTSTVTTEVINTVTDAVSLTSSSYEATPQHVITALYTFITVKLVTVWHVL